MTPRKRSGILAQKSFFRRQDVGSTSGAGFQPAHTQILALILFVALFLYEAVAWGEATVTMEPFGTVTLYQTDPKPEAVVLFVSGDGGWNQGVVDMARALSQQHALIAGIDIRHYLSKISSTGAECAYPAGDFENLSKYIQKKQGFQNYIRPILFGYSSGATLVYAILAEAPPSTFQGAISLGFCPDLELTKPLCKGHGIEWTKNPHAKGVLFLPAKNLENPWYAFQGTIDQVCNPEATEEFVKQVPNAHIVVLPKVGHGFSVSKNWMPQFKDTFTKLRAEKEQESSMTVPSAVNDLPLIELPGSPERDPLIVILTGDGGWANIDRELGKYFNTAGYSVIGWNSLKYFWEKRTPEESAAALNRVITHYLTAWKKKDVLLIGYSLGADVLPFMVNRLPQTTAQRVGGMVLLGPSTAVEFEVHVAGWLGLSDPKKGYKLLPEVEKLGVPKILCINGSDETDALGPLVDKTKIAVEILGRGHHFSGDYTSLAQIIMRRMGL